MRILFLESTSGLHRNVNPYLFPEGFSMLRTFCNEFEEAGHEVVTTLNSELERYESWINASQIYTHDELKEAMECDIDRSLVIAPEGELELIIRELKRNDIPILGSEEDVISKAGNKWKTYNKLKNIVPQPRTWDSPPHDKNSVVVKPKFGVGSEEIRLDSPEKNFSDEMIFQEPLSGKHASCCLLMKDDEWSVLSVNEQKIIRKNREYKYRGNRIPLENEKHGEKCAEIALKLANEMGLKGYCGVDLVINDEYFLIEVNPRITTSFVGLSSVLEDNLAELLVDSILDNRPISTPNLDNFSDLSIPRAEKDVMIESEKLDKLEKIPEIISPPYLTEGKVEEGYPIFLTVGCGESYDEAEEKTEEGIKEAINTLNIDKNAVTWT
ncbi:hypothetical protein AKJ52_00220 [candidate division MSBL1 archaeon SCGC-AAA382C18]|uniref:ATP-grasp domain-containing protein n=1 Tax=candidate division MSBL1 archaeon SCGC-AAA382C18 TaxID=1698281 RepID=A0A133VLV1_9EURY|nr:hypothetical protein AKJ52_00220 [candidate division MSBL1 archaeon SCGC-AAA382C18]